ncbi:MICOS complex subunit mic25a [Drosophila busckii]|uniref:MICOS complex subunit mic25a n=1 Tax=Drosophila busckii TaxID=30019 RepID=UPI00083F4D2A|nr:MICOS complex subunit mic25a [Drosophila busckii]
MGANNSKPQTVQMTNNSPFQISREVLERVEKSAAKTDKVVTPAAGTGATTTTINTEECNQKQLQSSNQQTEAVPTNVAASWSRRSTEIEESQFSKTMDRVHQLFGQPVKWAKANNCSADIETMEQQLINCYRQYANEPLKCAPLAKQYHTFVFDKQLSAAKKSKTSDQKIKILRSDEMCTEY